MLTKDLSANSAGKFLVESLFRDFRFALRGLGRDRRLALAAIFALSLGIGAMTVMSALFTAPAFHIRE
ncbi:MAG: hypothetical protein DMG54_30850 [Acidobacteria bacterium]|nr:MAG: hypothetical protein DMF76_17210 [Acidobacteriota bacterium]PYU38206.1 MAG: hypothetical protein DMG54_30850 [Acidobacteriota bacterium]PYU47597.1 MAG: hypothetical protein DMG53_08655 [Acidobacteriota bacterium]PYU77278.1 MAG: hypothetical protein DMG52_01095 [Acidobacteriota bacterium]